MSKDEFVLSRLTGAAEADGDFGRWIAAFKLTAEGKRLYPE